MSVAQDSTQTTPTYYQPARVDAEPEQHQLRVLIDEVATSRGLTIQMAMRLMSLAAAPNADQTAILHNEFDVLHAQFTHNMAMLFGSDPVPGVDPDHVAWIRSIVSRNPERQALLLEVERDLKTQATALDAGSQPSFTEARAFFDRNWPIVRDKMTELIWDLWADLDAQRNAAERRNAALQSTLLETLRDIRKFSTAIRMIAINSAVLATRPDQAGSGFQTISKEVRQLSEDIDRSTSRAQDTISILA